VAGGTTVTILGAGLGNGTDVTNVTFCGIPATAILSQNPRVIVAQTGPAPGPTNGDVIVCSVSQGSITGLNAFAYFEPPRWLITVLAGPHGSIEPFGSVPVVGGASTSLVVTAAPYYHIGTLLTNGAADAAAGGLAAYTSIWLNVTADGSVTASFAENLAAYSTPEWWLAQYGWTNDFDAAATNDEDHDGLQAWAEYLAGTIPTNSGSVFEIAHAPTQPPEGFVVTWNSVSSRVYDLMRSTNLVGGFDFTNAGLPATPPVNVYTDAPAPVERAFYRVRVRD
jgi:hypothetical protein